MLRPYWSQISLTLQVSQYLVGSRDVREEDPVAQPVERHPQRGEALSGGAVNGGDAEVLGEPVLRGEPKALSTELVVVGQIGPPFAGASSGDVVRKQPRKGGPDLPYYDELGRQGFRLAAEHRLAEHLGVASIYRSAAERFPTLRVAFNRLSDRVFFPNVSTPDKILRNL